MPRKRQLQRQASRAYAHGTTCARLRDAPARQRVSACPREETSYTGSNPSIGDRVQVKRGHKDVLYAGRNGTIIALTKAHGMTVATVQLDRSASVRRAIRVLKPIMELALLNPGEWRLPRPFDPRPEHQVAYGGLYGPVDKIR